MELLLTETVDTDNPVEGDLHLVGGNLVWTADLATEVAQRLRVRLRFFKGEWFLDGNQGTPWFQTLLVKGVSDQTIKAIFTKVIIGTEGVKTLTSLTFDLDAASRELTLDFEAQLQDGSTFVSKDFPPFIVEF